MLPPRIASAPKALVVLLGGVLVGIVAFGLMYPFQLASFVIRFALFVYLAWGLLGGRKSAIAFLALLLLVSAGVNIYQIREAPNPVSSESVIQGLWTIFLVITAAFMCLAPAARRHYHAERNRNDSPDA